MADTAEQETPTTPETPAPEIDAHEDVEDWKGHARKHEREAKKARKEADELRAQLAEHQDAAKSETERAIEQARSEAADAAKAEVTQAFRSRILNAEVRALAAGKFANPNLAAKLLDIDPEHAFGDDDSDELDTKYIADQIDGFLALEENAGLRASHDARPAGDVDAGKGTPAAEAGTPEEQHNNWLAGLLQRA